MSLRTRLHNALNRHDGYGDPTILNVRADTLMLGDRLEGEFVIRDVQAVRLQKSAPLMFVYDGMHRGRVFEGDEMVPIRLAGGAS